MRLRRGDSSDDEKPASVKRQQSDAKKAKQAVNQLNRGHQSTAAAESAAGTSNKSLAVPGAAGSAAVSHASSAPANSAPTLTVDVLSMMHKGTPFLKYGKSGYPHFRQFQLTADNSHIVWFSGAKSLAQSQVALATIDEIRFGQATANFARHPAPDLAKSSFSLIYDHGRQTLDLIAKDLECNS